MDVLKAQYTLDGCPGGAVCAGHLLTDSLDLKRLFGENMQISGHLWIEATSALLCHLTPALFPPLSLKITQSHCPTARPSTRTGESRQRCNGPRSGLQNVNKDGCHHIYLRQLQAASAKKKSYPRSTLCFVPLKIMGGRIPILHFG